MCNCLETVQTKLAEHNTRIVLPIVWGENATSAPMIRTEKIDSKKRGKEMGLFASFCPFCGEAYKPADKSEAA